MATLKPFKGLRPAKEIVTEVSSRPYDVMNTSEARELAKGKEKSLLRIIRPEIEFPVGTDEYAPEIYQKAAENFNLFQNEGWLIQDESPCLYVYAQSMNGRTQYGIVGCASVDDYIDGTIKRHELTRKDKEADRTKHVEVIEANMEPVFLTYKSIHEIDHIIHDIVSNQEPIYDFTAKSTGFGHHFWVINDTKKIHEISRLFATQVKSTYIADGHHRSAAAANAGLRKRESNPLHRGDEAYNYFLAVHFPENQLQIIDYNRVIKDLNGLTTEQFLNKLSKHFSVENKGTETYQPQNLHNFSLYIDNQWHSLTAHLDSFDCNDPIEELDVTISSNFILKEILNIEDLRTSKRIDFVGGIRGLDELKRRVDSGEMRLAIALYPVSMPQLMKIADTNNIMPPKTTWFEPKLRSGLIVHKLSN